MELRGEPEAQGAFLGRSGLALVLPRVSVPACSCVRRALVCEEV